MILSSAVKKYPKYYYKHPLSRTKGKLAPIQTQRVYPVLSAEQMLKQRGRRKIADRIRISCGAPAEYYNALYKSLIDNFAEFIQHLPLAHNHRICRLDKHLHLSSLGLSLREPYILAGEILNRTTNNEKALWNYVVFSSLLLCRLGQVVTEYNVSICDEKGVFAKSWEPFRGKMGDQGAYYKIRDIMSKASPIDSQLNFALARQLMPEDGYNWIASVPEALELWTQALDCSGEEGVEGLTASVFVQLRTWLAKQHDMLEAETDIEALLERYLEDLLDEYAFDEDLDVEFQALLETEPDETLMGERFYQWMRKGIHENKLSVNDVDSAVFMTAQGALLLHPEIFEKFIQDNPNAGQPQHVFEQFSKLGLIKNSNLESYVAKFPGMREQNVQGVLLKDPKILFGDAQVKMLTPYLIRANVLKRAGEKHGAEKIITENQAKEAQHKVHEADADRQEFPNLQKSDGTYKDFKVTNKPPMKKN